MAFLTAVPLPHIQPQPGDWARASAFYPLAGYLVGGLAALSLSLTTPLPAGVGAALTLGVWLAATGWLHFDGLVDSADALLAAKSPRQRLDILGDVHVGAFGLGAGVLYLLTFWSALEAGAPLYAPVAAAVLARLLVLVPMNLYPAARQESLGARSREGRPWPALLLAAPVLLWPGVPLAAGLALAVTLLAAAWAARRLGGGLSGDVYGLLICLAELTALLALLS
ncbi:adenosylcobinamide-GDP ribazoletransferase [Deinococcus radiophilus]|uniref:Adenosylcobinamide-GDP ribazoletransferase n=1 Tax=Deinococcus radiophilus TaxID=32062 RepID=A0A3S0I5A7_9DEIO|nr:adenosylcobinamide-GDP ribazoletransferase [Deinococcus radiophilus]